MTHFARLEFIILSAAALVRATTAYGADLGKPVTFSNDVAPILQRSCQNCHRPGSIAPMSLLTYKEARPWARSIKEKVVLRQMPPWHIDRNIGITKAPPPPCRRRGGSAIWIGGTSASRI